MAVSWCDEDAGYNEVVYMDIIVSTSYSTRVVDKHNFDLLSRHCHLSSMAAIARLWSSAYGYWTYTRTVQYSTVHTYVEGQVKIEIDISIPVHCGLPVDSYYIAVMERDSYRREDTGDA